MLLSAILSHRSHCSFPQKAELQTGTQRTRLKGAERTALNGGTQGHVASLSPGKSIDQIVAHEMREVGVHMFVTPLFDICP